MDCTVRYNQKEYALTTFEKMFWKAKAVFNGNINQRGYMTPLEIMRQDGLAESEPLQTTGTAAIHKKLNREFEEGIDAVRDYVRRKAEGLRKFPEVTISKDTIDSIVSALNKGDAVYEAVMEKLNMTTAERAAAAGVTEEEMLAYEDGEETAVDDKIEEYNSTLFTGDEKKLYNAMRRALKFAFPLTQRGGKILSPDARFADMDGAVEEGVELSKDADAKWDKVFGDSKVGEFFRKGLRYASKIVSIDNVLMKKGFQKGSIAYELLYYSINKANRVVQIMNMAQNGKIGELLKSKKYSSITKFLTNHKYENVKKEEITFAGGKKVNLSVAEIITAYLTLNQKDVKGDFVYQEGDVTEDSRKITVGKYGQRDETTVVVTERAFEKMREVAEGYPELTNLVRELFNEQHTKMNDTLFVLTGQNLPYFEDYFPTYEHGRKKNAYEMQQETVKDIRYVKERKGGIHNLSIRDVFSVLHNYVDATNYYSQMAVPIQNANTYFNKLKDRGVFDEFTEKIYAKWLKSLDGNEGQLKYGDADKTVNKFMRAYYKGTLGWNIPVVLKQPVSALHAWNFFGDVKYAKVMADAYKEAFTVKSKEFEEMLTHNPLIGIYAKNVLAPELGTFLSTGGFSNGGVAVDSGFGGVAKAVAKKAGDVYVNKSLELIRKFDLAGRVALWKASKMYVKETIRLSEADGNSYWNMVAEVHNQALEETQQTWDILHRSELGRSNNTLIRGFLMFTTQLQKHMSLMDKAVTNYVMYGRKEDARTLMRSAMSVMIVQSALIALLDMGKDTLLGFDDDDEDKFKNLAARTLSNDLSTIPFLQIYSNTLANAVFNEDLFTRPVSTPIVDFMQYFQEVVETSTDRKKEIPDRLGELAEGAWKEGSRYFGIPLSPVKQFEQYLENNQ